MLMTKELPYKETQTHLKLLEMEKIRIPFFYFRSAHRQEKKKKVKTV